MAKAIMLITEPLIITEKHLMNVLHKYLENFQTFALVFTSEPVSLIPYNMPTKHQSNPNPNKHLTQIQQFFKEQNTCYNLPNDMFAAFKH